MERNLDLISAYKGRAPKSDRVAVFTCLTLLASIVLCAWIIAGEVSEMMQSSRFKRPVPAFEPSLPRPTRYGSLIDQAMMSI